MARRRGTAYDGGGRRIVRTGPGLMKQIYYTQCPIGYGLGASNGFQIKRVSAGYALSGDFRHLGLRAYIAGSRTMAPGALRYRRGEDGAAEVAWLAPRTHEYETERGLWGRPGGHFAHGVQLDESELHGLGNWPAGLHDSPFWTRSDPVPSRNEPPEPRPLTPEALAAPPAFAAFETLAGDDDPEQLARLLTCLAAAAREGRTLFLIDEAPRLARRIKLLTLAFPARWRPLLTFSTYHDRPEELPGLRLQGTVPAARPNRPALLSLGIVVDLISDVWEPAVAPAPWARTLAAWLTRRSPADRCSWEATDRRATAAAAASERAWDWSDEALDRLYGLDTLSQADCPPPAEAAGWRTLTETMEWARSLGLAADLATVRPAAWWRNAPPGGAEAWRACLVQLREPAAWEGVEAPAAWGEAIADRLQRDPIQPRWSALGRVLASAPARDRPRFVRALVAALPPAEADTLLLWLREQPACDRAMLLPLQVRAALAGLREGDAPSWGRTRVLLQEALAQSESLAATLEVLAEVAQGPPPKRDQVAAVLALALEAAAPEAAGRVLRWALDREGEAAGWLEPYLKRVLAAPARLERWRQLREIVPRETQARFVRVLLEAASDPGLPREAFRWSVEEVLLAIPAAERPDAPGWARRYLEGLESDYGLLLQLVRHDRGEPSVKGWLDRARDRGELDAAQDERIVTCEQYLQALRSGVALSLPGIRLPEVSPKERGALLAHMLKKVGQGRDDDHFLVLDTCRSSWPEAFQPGAVGLAGLARTLAAPLANDRNDPHAWFARLREWLDRLGLEASAGRGFEPDGLAALVAAETAHTPGGQFDPWRFRRFLLRSDAWRILAADVQRDLRGKPLIQRIDTLARWDHDLDKTPYSDRFFEVWLNACDGATLGAAVGQWVAELRTLRPLSWWAAGRFAGARDDLREAFARTAAMAPIDAGALALVQSWLRPTAGPSSPVDDDRPIAVDAAPPDARTEAAPPPSVLSPEGYARWRCVEALSTIHRPGIDPEVCWQRLDEWRKGLPLGSLAVDDRYRFVAWFIHDAGDWNELGIEKLAAWIHRCGVHDPDRIRAWPDELRDSGEIDDERRRARRAMVQRLWTELGKVRNDERGRVRKSASADSP